MNKVSIIIPVFNDFDSVVELISRIESMDSHPFDFLIVDNGSTDSRTLSLLRSGSHNWKSVRSEDNLGFGGGILFGIQEAHNEFVGWMPGNLKVDPRDLSDFVKNIKLHRNIFVKAKRKNRSKIANVKTLLAGFTQSILLRVNMFDSGGTPTICHKAFIESFVNPPNDYVFESYVLHRARLSKIEIVRPSINYGKRVFGQSHWQTGVKAEATLMWKIIRSSSHWKM